MRPVLKKVPTEALYKYIKVDPNTIGVLRINFDALCQFLIQYCQRNFSISEFESMLQSELENKLKGKPVNDATLKAICDYVDSLSIYLTHKRYNANRGIITEDDKKKFFAKNKDRYVEFLEKAKHKYSPRDYEILKNRYQNRLNN